MGRKEVASGSRVGSVRTVRISKPKCASLDLFCLRARRVQITDALVVRAPEEARIIGPKYPDIIHYEVLECRDHPFENIIQFLRDTVMPRPRGQHNWEATFFPAVKQLLDQVLARGGRILVHGNAGMSRSAAFVVAYVMEHAAERLPKRPSE
eukprot:3306097-Amphidinium_carterae.1